MPPQKFSRGSISPHYFDIKKWKIFAGVAALLLVGGILVYFVAPSKIGILPRRQFSQTFALVQDKISQSAAIAISLPAGISINIAEASNKISFEPALQGEWIPGNNDRELIFRPQSTIALIGE